MHSLRHLYERVNLTFHAVVRVQMNVVPRSTMNTNGETEN